MKKLNKVLAIITLVVLVGATVFAAEQERRQRPTRGGQGRQMGPGGSEGGMQRGPGGGGGMQRGQGGPGGSMGMQRGSGGPGGMGQQDMQGMMMQRMLGALKLNKEQQTQVKEIMEDANEDGMGLQHEVMGLQRELQNLAMNEAKAEKIMGVAKKLGTAMGKQAVQKVDTIKEVKSVLTEEQLERLEGMQKQTRERMEKMHQMNMQKAHGGRGDKDKETEKRYEGHQNGNGDRDNDYYQAPPFLSFPCFCAFLRSHA